jgi:hypothetical protein
MSFRTGFVLLLILALLGLAFLVFRPKAVGLQNPSSAAYNAPGAAANSSFPQSPETASLAERLVTLCTG